MQIVAAGPTADPAGTPSPAGRFHALIITEGIETGDKRIFVPGSITWRDGPSNTPFMASDKTLPEHLESMVVGNFDRFERAGDELHGYGPFIEAEAGSEAARLIGMIVRGELNGVSADLDDFEYEVLYPVLTAEEQQQQAVAMFGPEGCYLDCEDAHPGDQPAIDECQAACDAAAVSNRETDPVTGREYEVVSFDDPILRVTGSRLMGATAVPFPAFQECFVTVDNGLALVAGAGPILADRRVNGAVIAIYGDGPGDGLQAASPLTAAGVTVRERPLGRFEFPDLPPAAWFEVPEPPGPMPLTIMDDGQVFGHLALWGECHVGIQGECVEAPPSPSGYARFHLGEVPCAGGERVTAGVLTFRTGHAAIDLGATATKAHYDDTGTAAADLFVVDGDYGPWTCGAMRPGLTASQVREIMMAPPSGDWRRFGRDLELVAALCVNVPGFNTPRYARVRQDAGLVASLVVSNSAGMPVFKHRPDGMDPTAARAVAHRIAASIGRSPAQRIAAARERVLGGR